MRAIRLMTATILALAPVLPVHADPNWDAVSQALGKEGAVTDGIYRVGLPRSDLKVQLDGIEIRPALALGSWLAFQPMGDKDAMVMGDLVLTQDEVTPVMTSLIESGVEVTALHNHLLRSEPATMYMHVRGHGDAVGLGRTLHQALAMSGTPIELTTASTSAPAAADKKSDLDTSTIDQALGYQGKLSGVVYQVSIPRADPVQEDGATILPAMGSAIAINFQPTGPGMAATTGDFVLTAGEVNPVMRALRENGIEVTALHNHMLGEQPRLFFMHFWGHDETAKLAKGLHAALGHVAVKKG
ncbi:DUF1259 domain-containing protein [Pseudaminobacter sp. 19-2017]|uniref:DUF1259 domain-containing protein n=1 Tax=Pseudaminobacter soli (ex Zhang et al. 2022) TaxID=2831468 RepID=A0A942I254_9HYPH|nr:DUF1259 domain-containing protein [Pseudaminobacter soli]MBS3648198.1 DUF1259 domain-containing protein [Pseudaminobacter soli]